MTGADLRTWRLAHGWTQATMAEWLGVSQNAISQWERASRPLPKVITEALRYFPQPDVGAHSARRQAQAQALAAQGWTRGAIATHLGVTTRTVSRYYQRARTPVPPQEE